MNPEPDKQTILVVGDMPTNLDVVKQILLPCYYVKTAVSGEVALKMAQRQSPDLILLDLMMAKMDGFEVLRQLKNSDKTRDIPVIFLTARTDSVDEARGLELGAADYITKPVTPAILKLRMINQLEIVRQRQMLEKLSYTDPLTRIANRRQFDLLLIKEWRRAQRAHSVISLAMVDVDLFKGYNDHYGHRMGDEVLAMIATQLQYVALRSSDLAARYGGEEFVLLLPGNPPETAHNQAEKARQQVIDLAIPYDDSKIANCVTISLGGVSLIPERSMNVQQSLVDQADALLYRAKREGRNRVIWKNLSISSRLSENSDRSEPHHST